MLQSGGESVREDASETVSRDVLGLSAAQPVCFANLPGLFTAADAAGTARGIAVLFLSPWGLEEFLTRKFYRHLAERFSAIGVASLRFDFPGTANAVDTPGKDDLEAWARAVALAAAELRCLAGVSRIVLIGQGLGAGLAYQHAAASEDLAGLALLAPVFRGRLYLRELKLWSKFVDDGLGLSSGDRDKKPGTIAGIDMPDELAADLKNFSVSELDFQPSVPVLLAPKPEVQLDPFVTEKLSASGCSVTGTVYKDFETLLTGATPPELPLAFADELVRWLQSLPECQTLARVPARVPQAFALTGPSFSETPIRFGENNRLIGTLCEPLGRPASVSAVILSTSYDYQIGWGRMNVQLARQLAQQGVATLRFDGADIGDSPPVPGRRVQVLYDDAQVVDAQWALEVLKMRGLADNVVIVGRCSGAYTAFQAALHDRRWKACVTINPYGFHWRFVGLPRTLKEYWSRLSEPAKTARLREGRIEPAAAAINIFVRVADRAASALGKVFPQLPGIVQRNRKVHEAFQKLAAFGTRLTIVYSEGDEAMASFLINFGENSEGLTAYPNSKLHFIPNADHNLTPRPARECLFRIIEDEVQAMSRADSRKL